MTCVIILGMHRSGTSCLAGSLQELGLYLGDVNNAAPFNKKGNKENSQTWSINDLVFEQSGGAWDAPPKTLRWDESACRMRAEFLSQYSASDVWGFKDPRSLLTLPFWLEASQTYRFVATFRHPLLVAKSLESRDGFNVERSLDLWLAYNGALLDYCKRFTIPIISYDYPVEKYKAAVAEIAKSLGLPANNKPIDLSFYDSSLRHQSLEGISVGGLPEEALPKNISQIYTELCEKAKASF